MKQTVYIETTVVSYLTAQPSRDLIVAAHQQVTRDWWKVLRRKYRIVTSPMVLEEAQKGDAEAAEKRMDILNTLSVLAADPRIEDLAVDVMNGLSIPKSKEVDAFHLAYAIFHRVDCFVTWNCAHFANPDTERRLLNYCVNKGLWMPVICTPEEMLAEEGATEDEG